MMSSSLVLAVLSYSPVVLICQQEMVTTYRETQWLFVASCHKTTTQITVKKENVLPQKVTFVQK
jgi:hypothetical protein